MKLELELHPDHEEIIKDIIKKNEIKRVIIDKYGLEVTTENNSVHTFPVESIEGINTNAK
ncbi:MAG: hypothetical protein H8D97_00420 [Proteobacteria bacterium]|nr:hypothetical protein [Pseudomonadota bacterium]